MSTPNSITKLCVVPAVLAALTMPAFAGEAVIVDFDSGTAGWSVNGFTGIEGRNGNPGAHIHHVQIDTFGIGIRNETNADFIGDYSAKGPVKLSVDIKTESITFGTSEVTRDLVIELRDYDNVSTGAPYVSVWANLGTLTAANEDWVTYSIEIDDPTMTDLPEGWGGTGAEDPDTFEPILPDDRTFADVLASVDEIQFTTFVPGFFFGFTNFDVRVDNIAITPLTQSEVIYETPDPFGGVFGLIGFDVFTQQSVATRFTPTQDYTLNEIGVWMMNNDFSGKSFGEVNLSLRTDDTSSGESIPSDTILESWTFNITAVGWDPMLEAVQSAAQPVLQAGENYWIVAESDAGSGVNPVWNWSNQGLGFTSTTNQDQTSWQPGGQGAAVAVVVSGTPSEQPVIGDLDGNSIVNGQDLLMLLNAWGGRGPADLDGNGTVGGGDLLLLLNNWG